jgi:hypothetical protein
MAFVFGVLMFVIVVGILDAGLPWPDQNRRVAARDCRTFRLCRRRKGSGATSSTLGSDAGLCLA